MIAGARKQARAYRIPQRSSAAFYTRHRHTGQAGLWLPLNPLCLPREGLTACGSAGEMQVSSLDKEIRPAHLLGSALQEGMGLGPS